MKRSDVFSRIPWSMKHCYIALCGIIFFRFVFFLFSYIPQNDLVYFSGMALWILMFGWMAIYPLWISHSKDMLYKPKVGLVLKEFLIAIPLVIFIIIVQNLILIMLRNTFGVVNNLNSAFSGIRNAPNSSRLYLLLVAMFTFGPFAEELFFRGLIYNALRQRIGLISAIIFQAFLFMLFHFRCPERGITSLSLIFALGIVLAVLYEWRKTIWSPIVVHALNNFTFAAPVIILMILNSHTPAKTWEEAQLPPDWLVADFPFIEKQATGEEQRLYAINTWGSQGRRMWKKEIVAMYAVYEWFPEDREACAGASVGIAHIYDVYLRDFRRAIVMSDYVLYEFRDQPEACAKALITRGWSYYEIGDYQRSRESLKEVVDLYPSIEQQYSEALEGLEFLDEQ